MKPALLLLGSGKIYYRGYILERISSRYRVILLSPGEVTWEASYIDEHILLNPHDNDAIVAAAVNAGRRHRAVGALTYHEPLVELTAIIARTLGLPGCTAAAALCRDKHAAREAFAAAGVPSARHALVHTKEDAQRAADALGYPVVVKPRALTASFGVSLASSAAELVDAVNRALANAFPDPWAFRPGVVLEEYLQGPEISVDSIVHNGRTHPLAFARKELGALPFFEETGHIVAPPDQIVNPSDEIRDVVAGAHRALGIDNAATHTELRLTSAGPRVIEVNGRSGGDLIPLVASLALGVDIPMASADVAAGAEPDLSTPKSGIAGIRFFYGQASGWVRGHSSELDSPRPDWLHELTWVVEPGDRLDRIPGRLYFSRVGYAIATAATTAQCESRLDKAERAQHVKISGTSLP